MATSAPSAVGNQLPLEFSKAAEDIDHQVVGGARVGRQFAEDYFDALAFEIALDDTQVRDVSGQPVHVVDQDSLKDGLLGIVAQTVEFRPFHDPAAPALVLVDTGYEP